MKIDLKELDRLGIEYEVSEPARIPETEPEVDVLPHVRNEDEFQTHVINLARRRGYAVAHFRKAKVTIKGEETYRTAVQADGKGFPDLFMIHRGTGHVVVAELKYGKNKPTPEQLGWLYLFTQARIPNYVWYPKDWQDIRKALLSNF